LGYSQALHQRVRRGKSRVASKKCNLVIDHSKRITRYLVCTLLAAFVTFNFERKCNMPVRSANAVWKGTLKEGSGHLKLESGAYEGPYTFASRFETAPGTNPEELIGAAHAGCYSMFLSALLTNAKYTPTSINTTAKVHLGEGPAIHLIELSTEAQVPGLAEAEFQEFAEKAKAGCPVSKALSAVEMKLSATLL
jgi:lipoyl-dependent peroxiredoxin